MALNYLRKKWVVSKKLENLSFQSTLQLCQYLLSTYVSGSYSLYYFSGLSIRKICSCLVALRLYSLYDMLLHISKQQNAFNPETMLISEKVCFASVIEIHKATKRWSWGWGNVQNPTI
jgi:hypothetical protein